MRLVFVRHGVAESRVDWAQVNSDDTARPLTNEGRRGFRSIARRLKDFETEISPILTSPWIRAHATADILQEFYPESPVHEVEELLPTTPAKSFCQMIERSFLEDPVVAMVGHEPHLSLLLSWLLVGEEVSFIKLKKGAVAIVDLRAPLLGPKSCELVALMQPKNFKR